MVVGRRKLTMLRRRRIVPIVVSAVIAVCTGCSGRSDDLRLLRGLPATGIAVVKPVGERVYPSITGIGGGPVVPESVFALTAALAEIRNGRTASPDAVVTVEPGDRVEVLIRPEPEGLCLVRTSAGTYCWLSAEGLRFENNGAGADSES